MQQDEPEQVERGRWLSFQLAAEEVERRRGCSWGAAQKAVLDACKSGKLKWRNGSQGGPDVLDVHFWHWLDKPRPKPQPKKRSRVKTYLAEMFHNQRVPGDYSRKDLRGDLLKRDKSLYPLDDGTVKSAVDEYNRSIRNDPKSDVG